MSCVTPMLDVYGVEEYSEEELIVTAKQWQDELCDKVVINFMSLLQQSLRDLIGMLRL